MTMLQPPLRTIYKQIDTSYALHRVYNLDGVPFRLMEINKDGIGKFLEMSTLEFQKWTERLRNNA